jgi:hypothetical protein
MPFRKCIERNFPHIVYTVVPERGLRNKRVAMGDFHARHGIKPHASEGDTMMVPSISAGTLRIGK